MPAQYCTTWNKQSQSHFACSDLLLQMRWVGGGGGGDMSAPYSVPGSDIRINFEEISPWEKPRLSRQHPYDTNGWLRPQAKISLFASSGWDLARRRNPATLPPLRLGAAKNNQAMAAPVRLHGGQIRRL